MKKAILSGAALSIVLFAAFVRWFQPGVVMLLSYVVLCLLAILTIAMAYRFFGYTDNDAVIELMAMEQRDHENMLQKLSDLQKNLDDLDVDKGVYQAKTLNNLLNDFHEVIANRFSGKHLSASTYMNAARTAQNQVMQNLSDMVAVKHSISSLNRQSRSDDTQEQLNEQNSRLNELLQANKQLFQALTDTSVEVANIEEIGDFERTEVLEHLKDLAKIARRKSS